MYLDDSDNSIIEISQNSNKSPEDLKMLDFFQIQLN